MNELEFEKLIGLLEDDFDGDFVITRKDLLLYLQLAKWNAKVHIKDELASIAEAEANKAKGETDGE